MEDLVSKMAEACSRVTAMLDVDDTLQAVVDEARSITGAHYSVLVTFEESGGVDNLVASGFTPEERRRLWAIPEGVKLFEYLNRIQEPLRIDDLPSRARAIELPWSHLPVKAFLGVPMRYVGMQIGNIYLGGKDGNNGEFSPEDEKVVGMFASHAAVVITNARTYREERRAKAQLQTLIDGSPMGVVVFDAKTGDAVTINDETRRIVGGMQGRGRTLDAMLRAMTFRHANGDEIPLDELPMIRAMSTGRTVHAQHIVIALPDGQDVTVLANAKPIYSEAGNIESVVVTLQDMTPLEEMERQRAQFLSMVSLRLRNPLVAIKGSTTTALESSAALDFEETRQLLRIIDEQADHMRNTINDFLDVTRIEAGTLSINPDAAELAAIVDEARDSFRASGAANPIEVNLPTSLPRVAADKARMGQALANLFSNASQRSPEGSVIEVSASAADSHVVVSVADLSEGMSTDQLHGLLDRFYRVGEIEGDGQIGESRLRLAVCKGIVENHGGRIWAEGKESGLGARFIFTIPVAALNETGNPEGAEIQRPTSALAHSKGHQSRVLVIDDDPQILWQVRNTLTEAGFVPVTSASPSEVYSLVQAERPHLILLDSDLPGADGFEVLKFVRHISDVPIIFLSGDRQDLIIARALEMGAADYIVKPFSPTELVARIKAALRKREVGENDRPSAPFVLGDLTIDYSNRAVSVSGRQVKLTATEYDLLHELSANAGRVLTHDQLLRKVWGENYYGDSQVLRTYVTYVRRKLGDRADSPKYIFTESRIGYRMPGPSKS